MSRIAFTVPLEPPSMNHYVQHSRGRHFKTAAARAWYGAVALFAHGAHMPGKEHAVEYTVFRGKGSKGDVDNYAKVILDGLVTAGVLKTDDSVVELIGRKTRDRDNPRTEIVVRRLDGITIREVADGPR